MTSLLQDINILNALNSKPKEESMDYWDKFKGKPFYCQDYADHYYYISDMEAEAFKRSECCTTHMMGLPVKDGNLHPLYDYQEKLIELEDQYHNLIDDKSTGIGDSELKLRHKAHLAINDKTWENGQAIVFTGPRLELAVTLIDRMKALFPDLKQRSKETVFDVYKTRFEAYPSHHTETARGLPNVVYILTDEFDFFPSGQQREVMAVQQRYMAKGNPLTNGVSTPNLPGGLLETEERSDANTVIRFEVDSNYKNLELVYEREVDDPLYCFIKLPYQIGMGRIYNINQIMKAKQAPSFPREYELMYGYGVGDVFVDFDDILQEYDTNYIGGRAGTYADPGFGSSKFGLVSAELRDDGIIYITEANEEERSSPSIMVNAMQDSWNLHQQSCKVDGANAGFIKDLTLKGIPALGVAFGETVPETEGSNTTITLKKKLPLNGSSMVDAKLVRIHPRFKNLISQMRAVKFDKMGGIDKSELPFDLIDAFDMMLWDMQGHDYSSIGITQDGKIMRDDTPKSKSVKMVVEKQE